MTSRRYYSSGSPGLVDFMYVGGSLSLAAASSCPTGSYLINQAPAQRSVITETLSTHWLRSSQEFIGVLIKTSSILAPLFPILLWGESEDKWCEKCSIYSAFEGRFFLIEYNLIYNESTTNLTVNLESHRSV